MRSRVCTARDDLGSAGINLDKDTMAAVYEKFGLEPGTQDFIGHAMALYLDDECVASVLAPRMADLTAAN